MCSKGENKPNTITRVAVVNPESVEISFHKPLSAQLLLTSPDYTDEKSNYPVKTVVQKQRLTQSVSLVQTRFNAGKWNKRLDDVRYRKRRRSGQDRIKSAGRKSIHRKIKRRIRDRQALGTYEISGGLTIVAFRITQDLIFNTSFH